MFLSADPAPPSIAGAPRLRAGRPVVVFTDLDGTLLDHDSYRPDEALPCLRALERRGVREPLLVPVPVPVRNRRG